MISVIDVNRLGPRKDGGGGGDSDDSNDDNRSVDDKSESHKTAQEQ